MHKNEMLDTQEYENFEPEVEIEWMKSKPWWKFGHFQTESVMSNLPSGKYVYEVEKQW